MSLEEKVLKLLHQKIGFNPESIGLDRVLESVRDTLSKRKIGDPEAFLNGLRNDNAEFYDIVNAVVIPETWFFRDGAPFDYLKGHVVKHRPRAGEALRCLSVPCSTGEEPYSIAMALLDAGLGARQFSIDAVDISSSSLERAKAGYYGQYSFRSENLQFRERYFDRSGNGFKLKAEVRATVNFARGNLLDPAFALDRAPYDVIFCRNLLIYFDAAGWEQAIRTLQHLLKDSGILFMGHAELLDFSSTLFESIRVPMTFAYKKKVSKTADAATSDHSRAKVAKSERVTEKKTRQSSTRIRLAPQSKRPESAAPDKLLDDATQLANRGELTKAAEICRRCLKESPTYARSYFLLGLIAEVEGKSVEAEEHYKRALYLDSQHSEAMVHMALLLEARGDQTGAAHLRKRARDAGKQT